MLNYGHQKKLKMYKRHKIRHKRRIYPKNKLLPEDYQLENNDEYMHTNFIKIIHLKNRINTNFYFILLIFFSKKIKIY